MMLLVAFLVLTGIFFAGWWALLTAETVPVLVTTALAVVWVLVNKPLEGPVLWVAIPGRGLTAGDLLSPVVIAAVAVRRLTVGRLQRPSVTRGR